MSRTLRRPDAVRVSALALYLAMTPAQRAFYARHPKIIGAGVRYRDPVHFRPVPGADPSSRTFTVSESRQQSAAATRSVYRTLGSRLGIFAPTETRRAKRAKAHKAARDARRGAPAVQAFPNPAPPPAPKPRRVNVEAARKGGKIRAATAVRGPGGRFVPRATPIAPGEAAPPGLHYAP